MFGIGAEVYIKRKGQKVLGVVTATSGDRSCVLLSNGRELVEVNNGDLRSTGVEFKEFALANRRHLTLSGKLKGWRNILPREEWWIEDESED